MKRFPTAIVALTCSALCCWAQAAQPEVTRLEPHGIQRGGEGTTVILHGNRLSDARQVLADLPGLTITEVKPLDNRKVQVHVKADASMTPGLYPIRLVTNTGISNLRLLSIGAMPVVQEVEPNSDFGSPQKVDLNVTVEGLVKTEDQDFYAVELKAGQTLNVEVEGVRLADTQRNDFLDPYVAILDAGRFEKATSDDNPLVQQDGLCSFTAPADGTYVVVVRDSAFGGNDRAYYRVHIGTFPRPVAIVPGGGQPGQQIDAQLVYVDGTSQTAKVQLPSEPRERFPVVTEDDRGVSPSPNWVRVNDLPVTMEKEPNDDLRKAPEATAPGAFCGVIGKEGDIDYFAFPAKKGQRYLVNLYARGVLRSPLDGVVNIYDPAFKSVGGNDDSANQPDSFLEFTAAADGMYVARITDHLSSGGPSYSYRLEIAEAKPSLTLTLDELDRYKAVVIPVPRGGQMAVMVRAARKFFSGELAIEALDLPPGITATTFPMPSNRSEVPLLLTTAEDAELNGSLVALNARPTDEKQQVTGSLLQNHKLVLGQNRREIYTWDTERVAVSVAEPAPFKISVTQPQVPVVRNGSMEFEVKIERAEGFTGEVSLRTLYNPPGVSTNNSRKIAKDKNEVTVPLTANGSAALGTWPMFLIASTATDNGEVRVTTQPIPLEIQDVQFGFQFTKGAAEQGTESEVVVGLEVSRPFEGEAEVELVGLPPGVSSTQAVQKITAETTKLTFPITVAADARPGTHKTLNCRATIRSDKGVIVQTQGTGELRVDKPLPVAVEKPKPEAEAKPKEAQPKPPAEKPLSRLEQLRQAKAAAAGS